MKRPKRTNESKELITDALMQLMERMPYEQINISEICTLATVSRNTFYRNFSGKEAVLEHYLLKKCRYIIQQFEQNETYDPLTPTNTDLLRSYERFYAYWLKQRSLILLLKSQHLENHLLTAMNRAVVNPYTEQWVQTSQGPFSDFPDYYYNWLSSSLCSILFSWANHDFDLPPQAVAELLVQISTSVTENHITPV